MSIDDLQAKLAYGRPAGSDADPSTNESVISFDPTLRAFLIELLEVVEESIGGGGGGSSAVIGPGDDYVFVGQSQNVDVDAGGNHPVVMDTVVLDPQGWLGTGSYDSPNWWGRTFPEGSWLLLPPGIYWGEVSFDWADDPGESTQSWFADIDDRFNDNIDLWQADSDNPLHVAIPSTLLPPNFASKWSTLFRIKETGAPYHWGLVAQHSQVDPLALTSIKLGLMRLSQFGGT